MKLPLLLFAILLTSCSSRQIRRHSDMRASSAVYLGEINGMVVQQHLGDRSVLLRAGNRLIQYDVPVWFNEVYGVGDTIK